MKYLSLISLLVLTAGCATNAPPADIVVRNVTIYVGDGSAPFTGDVVIAGETFVSVGPTQTQPLRASRDIDGTGFYVVPGLWDAHTHLRGTIQGGLDTGSFLEFGITSVHDLGGITARLKELERAATAGVARAPSIYSSYFMINGESFAGFQRAVSNELEVAAAVQELAAAGAVQVKVHRALDPALLPVLIDNAHGLGLKVVGHIPLGVHPTDACRMGMDRIEHVGSFVEALMAADASKTVSMQEALDYFLSDEAAPFFACLREKGTFVTPTLVVYSATAPRSEDSGEIPAAWIELIDNMQKITRRLHTEGVVLLSGTDTSDVLGAELIPPGSSLHSELRMMESAGIAPTDIIKIATYNASKSIDQGAETGTIAVGKRADFLLLSKDPGKSIEHLQSIRSVYKAGKDISSVDEEVATH